MGILLAALREQAAAVHAAKPEAQRDLERKMGLTHLVNTDSVQFDGVRQSFGGRTIEVPRG
ncbi:MAG: hypothetical protein EOO73_34245 [Myxococcales bacterium]|nr:MAG: hypothetical protein EOO73_34245 [Myxococcales bacterium]